MDSRGASLLKSGGIKTATTGIVALVGLASSAVLARSLDQTALGVFALILAMVQIGTMLADGGTSLATTRFIAATADNLERHRAVSSGFRARMLTTACIIVVAAVLMRWLLGALFHHSVSATAYLWALAWIIAKSLFLFAPAVARGRMNWTAEGGLLVLEALGILGAYGSLHWWPGDPGALTFRLAAIYLLMLALLLLPVRSALQFPLTTGGAPPTPLHDSVTVRRVLGFGLPLVLNSSFFLLLTWTDRIMIGVMCSPSDLAVYFIAANLAGAGRMLFSIPEQVLYSHLAASTRAGDPDLPRIHARVFRLFASVGTLFVVVAGAAGIFAIPLIYGSPYAASVWPFQLLLVVLLVRIISIPASLMLIVVFERTAETRDALGLAFVVNILVNMILIPHFGLTGAILGSLIAFVTATAYLWWSLWKVARLRAGAADLAMCAIPSAVWLAVVIGSHFGRFVPWLTWSLYATLTACLLVAALRQLSALGRLGESKAATL